MIHWNKSINQFTPIDGDIKLSHQTKKNNWCVRSQLCVYVVYICMYVTMRCTIIIVVDVSWIASITYWYISPIDVSITVSFVGCFLVVFFFFWNIFKNQYIYTCLNICCWYDKIHPVPNFFEIIRSLKKRLKIFISLCFYHYSHSLY